MIISLMYWQSKHHIGHAKLSFEWIPTYKQLLNTQSSCKKLYIIKQNYMHIKHPIYSFKLCAQGWSSLNLSLELQRATSVGPAVPWLHGNKLRSQQTPGWRVSCELHILKTDFTVMSGWHIESRLLSPNPTSLSINEVHIWSLTN